MPAIVKKKMYDYYCTYAGTNFVIGLTIVTNAANDDIAPRVPTALGLSFVNPRAVKGMNRSHEFFRVSMNTSL